MTYNVFGGMLNLAQASSPSCRRTNSITALMAKVFRYHYYIYKGWNKNQITGNCQIKKVWII